MDAHSTSAYPGKNVLLLPLILLSLSFSAFGFSSETGINPDLNDLDLGADIAVCTGSSVTLDGSVSAQSLQPQTFSSAADEIPLPDGGANTPGAPVIRDISVTGMSATVLTEGIIQSVCINIQHPNVQDLDVYLFSPGGQSILLTDDNGSNGNDYQNTCFSPAATQEITFGMPNAPASAAPFTGSFQPEGNWSDLWAGGSTVNGIWQVAVYDDNEDFTGAVQQCSITFQPEYTVTYAWSPDPTLSCIDCPVTVATPSQTTTYGITVTDSNGCSATDEVTITVIEAYTAPTVTCTDITVSDITFIWEEVANAEGYEISINAGPWSLPNNGPTSHSLTNLSLDETVDAEVRGTGPCFGIIGTQTCETLDCSTLNINASTENPTCAGASDGILDLFADGGTPPHVYTFNGESNGTGIFTDVPAGFHDVTITDGIGCTQTVTLPTFDPAPMTTTTQANGMLDCDNSTATADVTVSGGGGNPTFLWSNGDAGNTLTADSPGLYYVTVTAGACTLTDSVQIASSGSLQVSATGSFVCADATGEGTVSLTVDEGTAPFDYVWSMNAGAITGPFAENLTPDTYTVTVTDAAGCEQIVAAEVVAHPAINLSTTSTDADCSATPTGTATVTVVGEISDYFYLWNDAEGQTEAVASGLAGGLYVVTVTDENMCTATAQVTVNTPSQLTVESLTATEISCHNGDDGTATVTVSGGNGDFTYVWSEGNLPNAATITDLTAGNYAVTVIDAENCTATAAIDLPNPAAVVLTLSATDPTCLDGAGGSIDAAVLNAAEPIDYQWNTGDMTEDLDGISAGTYVLIITDADGCNAAAEATLASAAHFEAELSAADVSCYGYTDGAASVAVTGGALPYNYTWSNGGNTASLSALPAGEYAVTITDAQGCTQIEITEIAEPAAFTVTGTFTPPTCYGDSDGSITVTATGGNPEYLYSIDGVSYFSEISFPNLSTNNYILSATDAAGCITPSTELYLAQPEPLSIVVDESIDTEIGETAETEVLFAGGTGEILLDWITGETTVLDCDNCPDPRIIATENDELFVTLTDENGCQISESIPLSVSENTDIYIPNAVTPNADGNNDIFKPYSKYRAEVHTLQIYNRWGGLVYENGGFTTADEIGWNGKAGNNQVNTGVFMYRIEISFADGKRLYFAGDVTVL